VIPQLDSAGNSSYQVTVRFTNLSSDTRMNTVSIWPRDSVFTLFRSASLSQSPLLVRLAHELAPGQTSEPITFALRAFDNIAPATAALMARLYHYDEKTATVNASCSEDALEVNLNRSFTCCDSINASIAHGSVVVGPASATVTSMISTSVPYSRVRVSVVSASMVRACKNKPDQTELIYAYFTNGTLPPFTTVVPSSPQSSITFVDPVATSYPTGPNQLMFALPPFDGGKKCTDTIRICLRWEFTDANCVTCDTITCLTIIRKFTNIVLPPGGGGSSSTLINEPDDATTGVDIEAVQSHAALLVDRIYPNPASRTVTVDLVSSQDDVVDVDIIAVDGSVTRSYQLHRAVVAGTTSLSLDLTDIPAGRYSILVRGRTATVSAPFICE
jgi:hypothetical protein